MLHMTNIFGSITVTIDHNTKYTYRHNDKDHCAWLKRGHVLFCTQLIDTQACIRYIFSFIQSGT